MLNVLIIGAGGIGSYLCQQLDQLRHQWTGKAKFSIIDFDQVEEKNCKYQNYEDTEILDFKVDALSARYKGFKGINAKVKSDTDLKGYDLIMLAVDNNQVRCLAAKYCFKNDIPFLDMRSEGKTVMFMSWLTDQKEYWQFTEDDNGEGASCQIKADLEKGIVQNGNKIIAAIGAQQFLNVLRKESVLKFFVHKF